MDEQDPVLERLLAEALAPVPASAALHARLLALPRTTPQRPAPARLLPLRLAWGGGIAALAASALLGLWLGSVTPLPEDDQDGLELADLALAIPPGIDELGTGGDLP